MKKKYVYSLGLILILIVGCMANTVFAAKPQTTRKMVMKEKNMQDKDIVDIAIEDGRFTKLVAALKAAGLVDTLKGPGPFTVFAPTDDAFAKLPAGTVEELLKPENKAALTDLLKYHVISGKVLAKDATHLAGKEVKMLNQKDAKIEMKDGALFIDGAKIIMTDVIGKNGVIHVIDTVMMP